MGTKTAGVDRIIDYDLNFYDLKKLFLSGNIKHLKRIDNFC
jgi:hypothetical protein